VRIYLVDGSGYSGGTGGTIEVTVQTDDGTTAHAPSGTVLATTSITPGNPISIGYLPLISFPSPATLTAGQLYHVVFRNIDPNPAANFVSLDGVFMYQPTSPRQPLFSDVDWGQPLKTGSGAWADRSNTVPIAALTYANGVTQGLGYMEVWVVNYKSISGVAMAREAFTVSGGDKTVSTVSVRLMRISGTSPLTVRLETSDGTLVEQGTIPSSAIPIGTPGDHGGTGHAAWATFTFLASHVLTNGQSYNLVLSAPADTVYSIFVIRKGVDYSFPASTYFADGYAQYNPGTGWVGFTDEDGEPDIQSDLQFFFR
jgi:hypothetical protein